MPEMAIHYAVKANDHIAVLAVLAAEGAGADVVSGGELARARHAGIPAARIVFSGVGKTNAELAAALADGVAQINVESAEELSALSAVATAAGVAAPVALRVNPEVDAGTLDQISTGRAGDKFGVPLDYAAALYAHGASLPGIRMVGLAVHIGSQIMGMRAYAAAYARLAELVVHLRGQGLAVDTMDCGGGLGIPYASEPAVLPRAWAATIGRAFGQLRLHLTIEPGRWLTGPAGLLLASVVRTRRAGMKRPIVVLDAGMGDLLRPALYGAWHGIVPVGPAALAAAGEHADIAGPICESSDFFAHDRVFTALPDGAVVAILDSGAYGSVMSSTYNARPLAPLVLIDSRLPGGQALVRARPGVASLWAGEHLPTGLPAV